MNFAVGRRLKMSGIAALEAAEAAFEDIGTSSREDMSGFAECLLLMKLLMFWAINLTEVGVTRKGVYQQHVCKVERDVHRTNFVCSLSVFFIVSEYLDRRWIKSLARSCALPPSDTVH